MFEKKFLMSLFCLAVVLSFSATATRGANILFVSSMTVAEDDALKAFMEGLGHTVTYIDDDEDEATTEAAAAAADLVFISESVGSGGIKNEITEIETPMIVGEPYAWDEMGLTEGGGGDDAAVTTDVEIVAPGHYLAAGLSGTVAVLTDITSALGACNLGKGIVGPEATVIARATLADGVTYDVIFVYEKGAALPVAPADGSAQVAADIRIGIGFHANCFPVLSDNYYALLGAAVNYALGQTGPAEPVDPGTEGLVAHYAFENNANDASGNALHGTIVGDPNFVEGLSGYGMALDFDGIDDLVELGKFDVFGQITLAAWIRPDDFEINDARIISKAKEWGSNDHWWMLSTVASGGNYVPRFRLKTDESDTVPTLIAADGVLTAGEWSHVTAAWDGASMIPNVSVAIGSQPSDAFASDPSRVVKFFDGLIDEVGIYHRALSEPEIRYLAGERPKPVDPGTEALVAQYAFENDANDTSGNGLHGTIVGDPNFVEGLSGYGMALDFDGIDDLVELGKFDVFGRITLAAWIRPDDFEINDGRIISKAKEWGSNDHWWMLSTIASGGDYVLRFRLKTDESDTVPTLIGTGGILAAGEWSHVAASWDGSMMRIYKDGAEVASQEKGGSAVAVDPNVSVAIGSQPSDAFASDPSRVVKFFDGLIDEVGIYHRALSTPEIRYLAGERAPLDPGTEGLVAQYSLDNDANDASGNGHNGTVEGAPTWISPGWDGTGSCMQFGGDSDRITVESFDVTGSGITLSAWINPLTLMNDARVVSKSQGSGTADHYWAMILSGSGEDNVEFRLKTDTGATTRRTAPEGTDVQANEWTHVAVSWDATDPVMRLYKNGIEIDSVNKDGTAVATAADVKIGIGNQSVSAGPVPGDMTRPFDGLIDEVRIYDRALSGLELRYLAGDR
ncbi:MAG: LamG domain-containing protein [Planctomycetota bacterium]|jgi:hypothetical protein